MNYKELYLANKYNSHITTEPNTNMQNGNISDDAIRYRIEMIGVSTTMSSKASAVRPYLTIKKNSGPRLM